MGERSRLRKDTRKHVRIFRRQMQSPAWKQLSGSAVKTLLAIADLENGQNNGEIYFSDRHGAEMTGLSRNTVRRSIDELLELGFIYRTEQGSFGRKVRHAAIYGITWQAGPAGTPWKAPSHDYDNWKPEGSNGNSRAQILTETGSKSEPSVETFPNVGSNSEPLEMEKRLISNDPQMSEIGPQTVSHGYGKLNAQTEDWKQGQVNRSKFIDALRNQLRDHLENSFAGEQSKIAATIDCPAGTLSKFVHGRTLPARNRNSSGSLDLGVDELREAALAQQARALAAREVAQATITAATADGKFNVAMRAGVKASREYANEQERRALELNEQVRLNELVQRELNQTASATDLVAQATGRAGRASRLAANDNRASRTAFIQLGQQMQDVTVQAQLGTNAFTIFAQQAPQAAYALAGLSRSANATQARIGNLATFFAGPWGAAIFAATAVLGPYIAKLFEVDEALESVEFSSSQFGDAQSILGGVLDLTTGKIKTQSDALINLARAQAIAGQIEAQARLREAQEELGSIAQGEFNPLRSPGSLFNRGELARDRDGTSSIAERFLAGDLDANKAIAELENLEGTALATEQALLRALGAVANVGVEEANIEVFERLREALDGDREAVSEFLQSPKGRGTKDRSADEAKRDFEQSLKQATEFAKGLKEQEQLLGKSRAEASAYRVELAALEAEQATLAAPTEAGAKALREQAEAIRQAGESLANAQLRQAIEELTEESDKRLQIEQLLLAGREDEVAVLQEIARLERDNVRLSGEQRLEVERTVLAERDRLQVIGRLREQQDAYLSATQSIRQELESLLAGDGADFGQIFKRLQAKISVEAIFGDALRSIDQAVKASFGNAVDDLEGETKRTASSLESLADTIGMVEARIRNPRTPEAQAAYRQFERDFDATFGFSRGITVSGSANDNEGVEEAVRRANDGTLAAMTPEGYAELVGKRMVEPLLAGLPPVLARELSGVLGTALGGYFLGGPVTGGLGLLKGLSFEFGPDLIGKKLNDKILSGLESAFDGAVQGAATDAILDALGIKSSATGSAIGGALGSFLPIPGGAIIGSIVGGLLGGAFKGTPRGSATIGGSGSTLSVTGTRGTSGSREEGSVDLAGSVIDAIDRIADQLGASVNAAAGAVSIGIRDDNIRVDTTGQGRTKTANGALDFGQDAEAAVQAAVLDLIQDGVIAGLSASEQRLIQQGKSLEQALTDVLTFRSIFDRLERNLNPLRAELLALNREFEEYIDLFDRAGASTEERAKLEELYYLEREKLVEQSISRVAGSLQDLVDDLLTGNNGLSLRDRRANAQADFDALRARVESGDVSAIDDFTEASRVLLDIERQLFGSQSGYFDRFNEVLAISNSVLAEQERLAQAALETGNPFSISQNTYSPITDSISSLGDRLVEQVGREISVRLDAVNQNLGTISLNQTTTRSDRLAIGQDYF